MTAGGGREETGDNGAMLRFRSGPSPWLLALVLAGSAPPTRAAAPFAFVPAHAVLVTGEAAKAVARGCGFNPAKGDKLIDIEDAELLALAARLPDYLAGAAPEAAQSLATNYFQLAGYANRKQRVICVNAFPDASRHPGWRKAAVAGADGGPGAWRVAYDVNARSFARHS